MRRWVLFFTINIIFMVTITAICYVLGIDAYLYSYGQDYRSLFIGCAIWGFAGSFFSLLCSKWMAKWMMKVQIIEQNATGSQGHLLRKVHYLAQKAGLKKMPEVGLYQSSDLNAFATGPSRNNSLVAVSTGLLERMNEDEVEGVLAHEVAHIANGDMVTMTLLQGVMNTFVMFFARVVVMLIENAMRGGDRRGGGLGFFGRFMLIQFFQVVFGLLAMIPLGWFSRYREYRADAGSAKLVGPHKMIAALKKLQLYYQVKQTGLTHEQESSAAKEEPQSLAAFKISGRKSFWSLLATHPPLEDRIAALQHFRY